MGQRRVTLDVEHSVENKRLMHFIEERTGSPVRAGVDFSHKSSISQHLRRFRALRRVSRFRGRFGDAFCGFEKSFEFIEQDIRFRS
jgi:hypothetical protein